MIAVCRDASMLQAQKRVLRCARTCGSPVSPSETPCSIACVSRPTDCNDFTTRAFGYFSGPGDTFEKMYAAE